MMDTVNQAIKMMIDEYKKEYGSISNAEEGESIVGVFNDGVIKLTFENRTLGIDIVAGEPYKFDFNLDLLEKEGE